MTIEFNDPQLRAVYEANEHTFQWNTDRLNELSADIKRMDSLLKGRSTKSYVCLSVGNGNLFWLGDCVEYHQSDFSKKLIECSKEMRIHCKPYLAQFLKLCIEKIGEL